MSIHLHLVLRLIMSVAIPLLLLQIVTGLEVNISGLNCRGNCGLEMLCIHGFNLQQLRS